MFLTPPSTSSETSASPKLRCRRPRPAGAYGSVPTIQWLVVCVSVVAAVQLRAEDFLDQVESALTFSAFDDEVRVHVTTGASVSGQLGELTYAAEVKNVVPAARTASWDATAVGFDHPASSGRLGYRPNEMWNMGISFSDGPYFHPDAEPTLPSGSRIDDFHQTIIGQDISFAWLHLQLRAECQ